MASGTGFPGQLQRSAKIRELRALEGSAAWWGNPHALGSEFLDSGPGSNV